MKVRFLHPSTRARAREGGRRCVAAAGGRQSSTSGAWSPGHSLVGADPERTPVVAPSVALDLLDEAAAVGGEQPA